MNYKNMTLLELETYIEEQEPIKEKNMEIAYAAPTPDEFMRLSTIACKPIYDAHMYLKLLVEPHMKELEYYADMMPFEEFLEIVRSGGFINDDGYGFYATETQQTNIVIVPSNIIDGVYRKDFTHVIWYNR